MKFCQLGCARHNEPRRQNGQSRAFSRRVSAANCPEGKRGPSGALGAAQSDPQGGWEASRATGRPDTPCSRTAPEGSLPTERGQTVPALRPELDAPNKFGASNRSAPAGRSPRREAGRAASGVAVPLAFFGTFFRFERKYCPPSGRQPHRPRRSRRVIPPAGVFLRQGCLTQQLSPPAPFGPSRLKALPSGQR